MENFTFHNPTRIHFGRGALDRLPDECAALGTRCLVVTGGGSVHRSGLFNRVTALLDGAGIGWSELSGVKPNPEIDSVREGVARCRAEGAAFILAVGGGSVIDAAKAMAGGVTYDGDPWDFYTRKGRPGEPIPLGTVLTLAATGSEMNGNSVVSDPVARRKLGTYHPGFHPRFSILDPELTFSVPADQTAFGAMDILAHLFEQYFHHEDAPVPEGIAEALMTSVIRCAPMAVARPDDYEARATLLWASTMALNGIVAAGARGDWASHMIEHELSARYGIAHGAGLAVVFPAWMRAARSSGLHRFRRFAEKVWGIDTGGMDDDAAALAGIAALERFLADDLKIGYRLADYGIGDDQIDAMAADAAGGGGLGRFVPLDAAKIAALLRDAL